MDSLTICCTLTTFDAWNPEKHRFHQESATLGLSALAMMHGESGKWFTRQKGRCERTETVFRNVHDTCMVG